MTTFIAGIQGVGKTYLAKPAATRLGMTYATASQLIREERGRATWSVSKLVDEVAQNQAALLAAVGRIKAGGESLLLDGHFVLRKATNEHERLPEAVFRDLGCTAVVLLGSSAQVVRNRLSDRGDDSWSEAEVIAFARAEADHAVSVCALLAVPLITLDAPTPAEFEAVLVGLGLLSRDQMRAG